MLRGGNVSAVTAALLWVNASGRATSTNWRYICNKASLLTAQISLVARTWRGTVDLPLSYDPLKKEIESKDEQPRREWSKRQASTEAPLPPTGIP